MNFTFHWNPVSEEQKHVSQQFKQNDMIFLVGPAGSGKTHVSISLGLQCIAQGSHSQLIFIRPLLEAGEKIGFLPGTLDEKIEPFLGPLYHVLEKTTFRWKKILEDHVRVHSIGLLRGLTFENSIVVVSEAQNLTLVQVKLVLSRLGVGSKIILEGDPFQSDLLPHQSAWFDIVDHIQRKKIQGIAVCEFTELTHCRHPLVPTVLRELERL